MERPQTSSLPVTPGVYLYKDAEGRILYVGKARNLRKRLLSYFRPPSTLPPKTVAMLQHAATLETLSTGTEKEALLLEASLIKRHRPRYNIILRDDKQYVLFRIDTKVMFPRLEVVRNIRKDKARYFGPFTSGTAARETWKALHRAFPLRRCKDSAFRNRVRPCLYYHLGQCLAPCSGDVSPAAYAVLIHQVELLLGGRSRELLELLSTAMIEASDKLDFEKAAQIRDQLRAVESTVERQSVVLADGGDLDVVGIVPVSGGLGLGLLFVREGRLVDGRTFTWSGLDLDDGPELLWSFLSQFYGPGVSVPPRIVAPWLPAGSGPVKDDKPAWESASEPDDKTASAPRCEPGCDSNSEPGCDSICHPTSAPCESDSDLTPFSTCTASMTCTASVMCEPAEAQGEVALAPDPDEDDDAHLLAVLEAALSDLRGSAVRVAVPRNAAESSLVDMAGSNAREAARRVVEVPMSGRLGVLLHLDKPVERIECVDVSHTGGRSTRVGMVVFEGGEPLKSAYRTYTVEDGDGGGDDFASLAAWAKRRMAGGPPWADLVLVDGGKGQLSAITRALRQAGPGNVGAENAGPDQQITAGTDVALPAPGAFFGDTGLPFALAGIAKARDEKGRPDRRAGNTGDRIFLPGRSNPLPLRDGSAELLFLQHVRDTAHHYVLGRHRKARSGAALTGELLRIPGVGMATAKLLWSHFPSLAAMTAAGVEDLSAIPGIGPRKAAVLAERLALLRQK